MGGRKCPTCGAPPSCQTHKLRTNHDLGVIDYVNNFNPVDGVECPHCGYCFRVCGLDVDEDGMLISEDVEFECAPKFCPECGEKLGDE